MGGGAYEKEKIRGEQFDSPNTKANIYNTVYTDPIARHRAWRRGNYH